MGLIDEELIGKLVTFRHCDDGREFVGVITNETANMFCVDVNGHQKKLIKKQFELHLLVQDKKITIQGKDLVGRPDQQIKKWLRKKKKR